MACIRPWSGCLMVSLMTGALVTSAGAVELLQDRPTGISGSEVVRSSPKKKSSSYRDFRFSLGTAPGIRQAEMSATNWGGVVECSARTSVAAMPSYVMGSVRPTGWGLGLSVGVPWRRLTGDAPNGDTFSISAYGVELAPLALYKINASWHGELSLPLAAGFARHSVPGFSSNMGNWWSTGIRAGAYCTMTSRYQLGVELGYLAQTTLGRIQGSGGSTSGVDVTYRARGVTAAVSIGYRF